jgi:hypothetical protein
MQEIISPDNYLQLLLGGILAALLFISLSLHSVFRKLGISAWKAWIPLVNGWTFFRAAGMSGAWVFGLIVPILGSVIFFIAVNRISTKLGFDGINMVILAVFFPAFWLLTIAVSHNRILSLNNKTVETGGRQWALVGAESRAVPAPHVPQPYTTAPPPQEEPRFGYSDRSHIRETPY